MTGAVLGGAGSRSANASSTCVARTARTARITSSRLSRPVDPRQIAKARGGDAEDHRPARPPRRSLRRQRGRPAIRLRTHAARAPSMARIIIPPMGPASSLAAIPLVRASAVRGRWPRSSAPRAAPQQPATPCPAAPTPTLSATVPPTSVFRTASPRSRSTISTTTPGGPLSRWSGRRRRDSAACRRRAGASRAAGPRVFETYKSLWEVFHRDGSAPDARSTATTRPRTTRAE